MQEERTMRTKDILATELRKAGLNKLALRAEQGLYDDYLSPLDFPSIELDKDLKAAGTAEAEALRQRHHNGEFDATKEESDEWASSDDGRAAFEALTGKRHE
jgi:hypothetical protein